MTSPYLARIRAQVGSQLLLLPSVTVLVFDAEHRVLLLRHRDTGRWVAPGGMVEPDESPAAAAVREMREETGYDVRLLGLVGAFGGPEFRVRYANGDEVAYVMTVYRAEITGGEAAPTEGEAHEMAFLAWEELAPGSAADWLLALRTALAEGAGVEETRTDEAEVRALEASWDAAWNAGAVESLLASLAADAVLVNPRGEVARGHGEIRRELEAVLGRALPASTHSSTISRVSFANADVAVVDGEASVTWTREDGAPARLTHRFTDVLVKRDGRWSIAHIRACPPSEVPVAPAPAPTRDSQGG